MSGGDVDMEDRGLVPRGVWESLDWNRTAREIATELGVSYLTVIRQSDRLGVRERMQADVLGRRPDIDWSEVDFDSLSNNEIAEIYDYSLRHISRMRSRHEKPKGENEC